MKSNEHNIEIASAIKGMTDIFVNTLKKINGEPSKKQKMTSWILPDGSERKLSVHLAAVLEMLEDIHNILCEEDFTAEEGAEIRGGMHEIILLGLEKLK